MSKRKLDKSVSGQYALSFDEEAEVVVPTILRTGGTMTVDERTLSRQLFQNKIYKADGQKFEDIFTDIMTYAESDFQKIKPWGNIGDRKNDGYIKSKGIYFQVYAPEDIRKSYTDSIRKLETDFRGLLRQWDAVTPVKEYYFVLNDKYKGIHPDSEQTMTKLIKNNNLRDGGFKTAKHLEDLLFSLADDQIQTIVGFIPDPAKIRNLDYSILNEVIEYIKSLSLMEAISSKIELPDWNEKIKFNKLCPQIAQLLNNSSIQMASLDKYLNNQSNFLADELRDKMNEIYITEKINTEGNELFWHIVNRASPRDDQAYQSAVIVIMAKYFEACDIFERPPEDNL